MAAHNKHETDNAEAVVNVLPSISSVLMLPLEVIVRR
jgi:hypothetical protein